MDGEFQIPFLRTIDCSSIRRSDCVLLTLVTVGLNRTRGFLLDKPVRKLPAGPPPPQPVKQYKHKENNKAITRPDSFFTQESCSI